MLPALETIKRVKANGPLRGLSGVLNGTCNFVIEQLAAGKTFAAAVGEARERGYAEANPELDLEGIDAAQKLILLARAAFAINLPLPSINRQGIQGLNAEIIRQAQKRGHTVRLVAECRQSADGTTASVRPVQLPLHHPLAQVVALRIG